MKGYVANTDIDWFRFLAEIDHPEEVNFWQPSGRHAFRAISPNEPFFFKLKSPYNAIGGFGTFVRHSILPEWLAWESFGIHNGTPTFEHMKMRVRKYRGLRADDRLSLNVGCIMIANPVFFSKDMWIHQPRDWKRAIVQGKTYDLTAGEGQRIWTECMERAQGKGLRSEWAGEMVARYGDESTVRHRLGQGSFRVLVTDAYERTCAITTEHSLPVLEAAHIRPYAKGGAHEVSNGLLLRSDVHRLFDKGYMTIAEDHRIEVSQRLRDEFQNGKAYYPYHGQSLVLPRNTANHPDPQQLEFHRNGIYLG